MLNPIYYQELKTPIGSMVACAMDSGLCFLEFYEDDMLEAKLLAIEKYFNVKPLNETNLILQQTEKELHEYFLGSRQQFDVMLQLYGTDFQKQVWKALQTIPYGSTRSYMQQTLSFTTAESIRAVANANGKNRIAIVVPCHRVIGSNGTLTGYAGGLWRKKYLLELEATAKQGRLL